MQRKRGRRAGRTAARGLVLGVALVALALAAVGGTRTPPRAAAHPQDTPTINIQIPVPDNNGVAQGPVGTNLTLNGSGLTAGHTYQLGYAPQSAQCTSGGPTFPNATVTPTDGTFTTTVKWPATTANVGGQYYICALDKTDTTQPPVQSTDLFRVVAANAPTITLQDPATSAPLAGPPFALNLGAQVIIAGHNFLPGNLTLVAYLSQHQIKSGGDLDNATALSTANSTAITPNGSGDVTATIQLPAAGALTPGNYYLYLVSSDRQGASLPSLMASTRVQMSVAPTATATPKPTATPKVTATPGTTSGGGPSPARMLGVIGLSLLSLILLIAGVLLLVGGPRRMP